MVVKTNENTNNRLDDILAKQEKFLEAFLANRGVIHPACEMAGIVRTTYYVWMEKYPEFKQRVEDIDEMQIDFVESKLLQGINAGSVGLISFYLSTKARKRGYAHMKDVTPEPEEFTNDDQKLMNDYIRGEALKLTGPSSKKKETEKQRINRLKAEAQQRAKADD